MHGFNGRKILVYDIIQHTASFLDISQDPSDYSYIRICVYKDLDIAEISEFRVFEDQDPLYYDDLCRIDSDRFIYPVMDGEIIYRSLYGLPFSQCFDMFDHNVRIKGIGMVVVDLFSFFKRNVVTLLVIKVMAQNANVIVELFLYLSDKSTLAAAGAACNTDNYRFLHDIIPSLLWNRD